MILQYLRDYFRDPYIASITPTCKHTVKKVCEAVDFKEAKFIIEYGPGNGVFTQYLLDNMGPNTELLAIETNPKYYEVVKERFLGDPRFFVKLASAEDVVSLVRDYAYPRADYVISGIPFSFMDSERKANIITATRVVLKTKGRFIAYHFFPLVYRRGESMRKALNKWFLGNVLERYYFINLPPLKVYEAYDYPFERKN